MNLTLAERIFGAQGKMTATFLKVKESVELGQHERLLSYGSAFRPITVGQPLKGNRNKKGGLHPLLFFFIYTFLLIFFLYLCSIYLVHIYLITKY